MHPGLPSAPLQVRGAYGGSEGATMKFAFFAQRTQSSCLDRMPPAGPPRQTSPAGLLPPDLLGRRPSAERRPWRRWVAGCRAAEGALGGARAPIVGDRGQDWANSRANPPTDAVRLFAPNRVPEPAARRTSRPAARPFEPAAQGLSHSNRQPRSPGAQALKPASYRLSGPPPRQHREE
ncbi:hypothetical protein FM112_04465 [Gulosibacter sp. 10]|nr:hypothetical protein FM112_04465 [Gulosibacter sp. 10]